MENTIENKARFFAQYLDQRIFFINGWNRCAMINDAYKLLKEEFKYLKKSYLELTPLSQITDKHAIEIAKMFGGTKLSIKGNFIQVIRVDDLVITYWITDSNNLPIKLIDYLRYYGYAIPYLDLTIEDLLEYGWIKLKEK